MKQSDELNPKVVLAIGAHADDMDCCAGGALAKWAGEQAEVYQLIVTDGSKGVSNYHGDIRELAATRRVEQQTASIALGLKDVFFLNYEDGALENTQQLRRDLVRYIRRLKPDVVVTWDPSMLYCVEQGMVNHTDHRVTGQATLDSVYPSAGNSMTFPELLAEDLHPHKVQTVLLLNFTAPNYVVDISYTFEHKTQAMRAHVSQFAQMDAMIEQQRQAATNLGQVHGFSYAEGFVRIDIK